MQTKIDRVPVRLVLDLTYSVHVLKWLRNVFGVGGGRHM
jgi:hypothetical protein